MRSHACQAKPGDSEGFISESVSRSVSANVAQAAKAAFTASLGYAGMSSDIPLTLVLLIGAVGNQKCPIQ